MAPFGYPHTVMLQVWCAIERMSTRYYRESDVSTMRQYPPHALRTEKYPLEEVVSISKDSCRLVHGVGRIARGNSRHAQYLRFRTIVLHLSRCSVATSHDEGGFQADEVGVFGNRA